MSSPINNDSKLPAKTKSGAFCYNFDKYRLTASKYVLPSKIKNSTVLIRLYQTLFTSNQQSSRINCKFPQCWFCNIFAEWPSIEI